MWLDCDNIFNVTISEAIKGFDLLLHFWVSDVDRRMLTLPKKDSSEIHIFSEENFRIFFSKVNNLAT